MSTPYNAGYVGSSLNQFSLQMINEYFVPLPNEFLKCTSDAKWPNAKCLSSCKKVTNVNWSSKNATKPFGMSKAVKDFSDPKTFVWLSENHKKAIIAPWENLLVFLSRPPKNCLAGVWHCGWDCKVVITLISKQMFGVVSSRLKNC